MSFTWPDIDPNEVLDYSHDWSARLDGDIITGAPECIVESGVVIVDSTTVNDNIQIVWLSGAEVGPIKLTLRVTTAGGRTFDEGIKLKGKIR